jgi:hypothetical protein
MRSINKYVMKKSQLEETPSAVPDNLIIPAEAERR